MKRVLGYLALCASCLVEPVFHAAGLPHPEGLGAMVANYFATRQ